MMDAPHGGDIYAYDRDLLDFSVNLNPLGMPDRVLRAIREHAEEYDRYPDPHCRALRRALSVRESVPEKWLVFGNGAADLIGPPVYGFETQAGAAPGADLFRV